MAEYFCAETAFSRLRDDNNALEPWNKLVHYLCESIPRDALDGLISLARHVLGSEYHNIKRTRNCIDFFNTLYSNLKEDTVEYLYNLFVSYNDLHDDTGMIIICLPSLFPI